MKQITKFFHDLSLVGGTRHNKHKPFIFKDLATTNQVFLRRDKPGGLFDIPYDGPYTVNNRKDKTFDLEINGKIVTVTIDRLKPAKQSLKRFLRKKFQIGNRIWRIHRHQPRFLQKIFRQRRKIDLADAFDLQNVIRQDFPNFVLLFSFPFF